MKKLVLFIILILLGVLTQAKTTTIDGEFILDKTTVRGGDLVNLALLGLDAKGEVDIYGERDGATIIAVVRSEIGRVIGGDSNPGESPNDIVSNGNFAANVKYIRLTQGTGRVHINYLYETEGTDNVEIILMERTANPSGGVSFNEIVRTTKIISVVQAKSSNPLGLDITAFIPSNSDTRGEMDCIGYGGHNNSCAEMDKDGYIISMAMPNDGINGTMTAGKEGGKIYVEAVNNIAVGNVTVTLRKKIGMMIQCPQSEEVEPISYTAKMQKGLAVITIDNQVVKSGEYYIEAYFTTLNGELFEHDSVDLFYPDIVNVYGTGNPSGLVLCSDKTVVSKAEISRSGFPNNQVSQGIKIKAILVDEYGNVTNNNTGSDIRISVQDANGVFSNTALNISILENAAETVALDQSGIATDSVSDSISDIPSIVTNIKSIDSIVGNTINEIVKLGTTSLMATAVDNAGRQLIGINSSVPLEIKVVRNSLLVSAVESVPEIGIKAFNTSQLAGTEFDAFTVYISDVQGSGIIVDPVTGKPDDPGAITIKTSSGEKITVNRKNDIPYHVQAFFKKATDKGTYLVGDALGNFGQVIMTVPETDPVRIAMGITEAGILPSAATVVELQNAHGVIQTNVAPGLLTNDNKYIATLPEAAFKLFDGYGNSIKSTQPFAEDDTGTFRISSAWAKITYHPRGYGIPGRIEVTGRSEAVKVIYDTDGEGAFAGEDTIQVTFTKPGLGVDGLSIRTIVPMSSTNEPTITSYIETTEVPINSVVAMAVELTDIIDLPFSGKETFIIFEINTNTNGFVENLEIVTPQVSEIFWKNIKNRPEIKCKEAGGFFDTGTAKAEGGIFIGDCREAREIFLNSGINLNFTPVNPAEKTISRSNPPSSKVFTIYAGATEGQFSLTFYNVADPEEKETRIFTVRKKFTEETDTVNISPVASFTASPTQGPAPLAVTLDGNNSTDPDGTVVGYSWWTAEGITASGENPVNTMTFPIPGIYIINFAVSDDKGMGNTNVVQQTVTVTEPIIEEPPPIELPSNNSLGQAIIIAGGGSHQQNTLFQYSDNLSQQMYQMLKQRGYTDDDIIYMNPRTYRDQHGNQIVDHDLFTPENQLETAFNTINLVAGQQFFFYIHSHARPDYLKITREYELSATALKNYLDKISDGVEQIIIIDTCYSGSFLDELTGIENRTVLTSADALTTAWNVEYANFSDTLIRELRRGGNLKKAFFATEDMMTNDSQLFGNQRPQLDDNSDGIYTSIDGSRAARISIGKEGISAAEPPTIIKIHPRLELTPEQASAVLWIKTSPSGDAVKKVRAILIRPSLQTIEYQGEATDFGREELEMGYNPVQERYELVYEHFREAGNWRILYQAQGIDDEWSDIVFGEVQAGGVSRPVTVTIGLNQSAYQVGERIRFDMTVNADENPNQYDLYSAVVFPQGYYVTISYPLNFSLPDTIQPYQSSLELSGENSFSILDLEIPQGLKPGAYSCCSVVTNAGTDPWQEQNWIDIDCKGFELR